ncbi:MAG TPA: hypothetical protein VFZ68_16660 [Acidimicrobiales bacterium]
MSAGAGPPRRAARQPVPSALADLGVDAVYGAPLDGVPVIPVPPDLAPLFADAHRRLTHRPAAVHDGGGALVDPRTGAPPEPAAPVDGWVEPDDAVVQRLRSAGSPAVLAGPGVVSAAAVPGLHALAVAGSVGVLNTWGAKGVFDWRSRHHLATVGLQARDFELGGLAEADLIVAVGLDPRETLADWRLAPVLELAPGELDPLAERWHRPRAEIAVPPIRSGLAAVTQSGWRVEDAPLPPTRVTQHYGQVLGAAGLVAADPGTAGFWVARTFATRGVGGAHVPSDASARGFAIACVTVARLQQPGRVALAVVDDAGAAEQRLLDAAAALGVGVPVEVWAPDGERLGAAAHRRRLARLLRTGGIATIGVDGSQMDEILAVAGDVVAWTT